MSGAPLLNSIAAALVGARLEIITSKRPAGRLRDQAVFEILEITLREKNKASQ